jgi:hypothetical protein
MLRALGYIALLATLLAVLVLYTRQIRTVAPGAANGPTSPRAAADLAGVKMDLTRFAQAEHQHQAFDGHYVSLGEMLEKDTGLPAASRGPYSYSIEVSENSFTVTATYQGAPQTGTPATISIDQEGNMK